MSGASHAIELAGVSYRYSGSEAGLRDVDLTVCCGYLRDW
jgi:hypothetical protein